MSDFKWEKSTYSVVLIKKTASPVCRLNVILVLKGLLHISISERFFLKHKIYYLQITIVLLHCFANVNQNVVEYTC